MDKFDRRPDSKTRRALLVARFVSAAVVGAFWYVVHFQYGNAAWPVSVVVGSAVFGLIGYLSLKESQSARHLAWSDLAVQGAQGPGFTPLEVAAIHTCARDRDATASLRNAEVVLRWNTGRGCLTAIRRPVDAPRHPMIASSNAAWFRVSGIQNPVGSLLWPTDDDGPDVLEFFCGGERTTDIDWSRANFAETDERRDATIPRRRPDFDLDRIVARITAANATQD